MVRDMSIHCSIISCGTKVQKKVLRDRIDTECRRCWKDGREYKFTIRHGTCGPHPPAGGLQAPVLYPGHDKDHEGLARGCSSGLELRKELWGGHLWNPSYCAVTVSDRSSEQVERYPDTKDGA